MKTFLATKKGEAGHPNGNGQLSRIINEVINSPQVTTLDEFHAQVNEKLWQLPEFSQSKEQYNFKYIIPSDPFTGNEPAIVIGESSNLLFWLIADGQSQKVAAILIKCNIDITNIRDSYGNTLLHIASFYGNIITIKDILTKIKNLDRNHFSKFINSRNNDGTNSLGMAFLNPLNFIIMADRTTRLLDVAREFIQLPLFKINSLLNNKKGMDYQSRQYLKQIGGYTCLHMSLMCGQPLILQELKQRNVNLRGQDSDYLVNFRSPSLNPQNHMTSPNMILQQSQAQNKQELKRLLDQFHTEQIKAEEDDESGDSADEGTPANFYKKTLLDLPKKVLAVNNQPSPGIPLETKDTKPLNAASPDGKIKHEEEKVLQQHVQNILIPHFHGLPFMRGHYTNAQRRAVARAVLSTEEGDNKKGIHSRTSTSTAGIENLFVLINSDEEVFLKLDEIDNSLKKYLSDCWKNDSSAFLEAVATYVYDFSANPIQTFWNQLSRIIPADPSIVKYRFPFISTSKAPDHPIKFAFGTNVETQQRGELPFKPIYDNNAKPKHRLAGFIYITMHTLGELQYLENSHQLADLPKLIKHSSLHTRRTRTNNQLETMFSANIDSNHIIAIIPIVYPNFNKKFQPGYHDLIWNLRTNVAANSANNFNSALNKFRGRDGDIALYNDNITPVGRVLMSAYTQFALRLAFAYADSRGKQLCFISAEGKIEPYPRGYNIQSYFSEAQLAIKKPIDTATGAYNNTYAPEKLNEINIHKMLAAKDYTQKTLVEKFIELFLKNYPIETQNLLSNIILSLINKLTFYSGTDGYYCDGLHYQTRKFLAKRLAGLAKINPNFVFCLTPLLKQKEYSFLLETSLMLIGRTYTENNEIVDLVQKNLEHEEMFVRAYAAEALIRLGIINIRIISLLIDIYNRNSRRYRVIGDPDENEYEEDPESPQEAIELIGSANTKRAALLLESLKNKQNLTDNQIINCFRANTFSHDIVIKLVELLFNKNYQIRKHAKKALKNLVVCEKLMREAHALIENTYIKNNNYQSIVTSYLFNFLQTCDDKTKLILLSILTQSGLTSNVKKNLDCFRQQLVRENSFKTFKLYLINECSHEEAAKLFHEWWQQEGTKIDLYCQRGYKLNFKIPNVDPIVDQLICALSDEQCYVRLNAIKLLEVMEPSERIISALYESLEYEDNDITYFYLARALFNFGEDSHQVINALFYSLNTYRVRLEAAKLLMDFGIINSEVLRVFIEQTYHPYMSHEQMPTFEGYGKTIPQIVAIERKNIEMSPERMISIAEMENWYLFVAKLMLYPARYGFSNLKQYFETRLTDPKHAFDAAVALLKIDPKHNDAIAYLKSLITKEKNTFCVMAAETLLELGEHDKQLVEILLNEINSGKVYTSIIQKLVVILEEKLKTSPIQQEQVLRATVNVAPNAVLFPPPFKVTDELRPRGVTHTSGQEDKEKATNKELKHNLNHNP